MNRIAKKLYHGLFRAFRGNDIQTHPVRWLEIEVTRRCVLSCLHCGSSCGMEQPLKELSMDEIMDVCRRVAKRHNPKKVNVAITGGEAFLRADLFHIIARITEMGFRASVVTNGYLLGPKHVPLLYAAGIRSLSVSLDGMENSHNWLRNRKDAFQKAVNALRVLRDSGLFYVEAITIVNKRNYRELEEIRALLKDIGVHAWRLGKTFPIGRAAGNPELFLDREEMRGLLDYVRTQRRDKKNGFRDICFCEDGYYGENFELEIRGQFHQCPAGVSVLTVLADGSITGCAAVSHDLIQGNILRDDVMDVWDNKFQVFRDRSWMKKGKCGNCSSWENCLGGGMHHWEKDGDNPSFCGLG